MSSKRNHTSKPSAHRAPSPKDLTEGNDQIVQEPSPEPRPIAKQPAFEAERIGDILRRVREHRGEDVESISDYLRIRANYLTALENSRYEDLPADAYVIGFLRTYALYLGLDGRGAIDQYRREMAGRRRKPQLSMPQPMPEGRAPTIAVLVGAAAAALLVYGLWYGLSSPDPATTNKTTPPSHISDGDLTPLNGPTDTANSIAAQTATSDGIALTVPVSAVPAKPLAVEDKAVDAPVSSKDATPEVKTESAKDEKETDAKPVKETKAETPSASKNKVGAPQPLQPTTTTETPIKDITPASGEKTRSRVTVKADKETWIMVTDSKGVTVFEKTLKAGETYNVPTGRGLKLTTGNAASISFDLDGKALPKISSTSDVARAIPLEPEKLKNRLEAESPTTEKQPQE